MAWLVDGGFESRADAAALDTSLWSVFGTTPTNYEYDTLRYKNGKTSLWIKGPSSSAYGGVSTPMVLSADDNSITWWQYFDTANQNRLFRDGSGTSTSCAYLRWNNSGNLTVYTQRSATGYTQNGYTTVQSGYTEDAWRAWRITYDFTNQTYTLDVSTDGSSWTGLKATGASTYNIPFCGADTVAATAIAGWQGYSSSALWIDDVSIVGTAYDTLSVYSNASGDGYVSNSGSVWATVRTAESGSAYDSTDQFPILVAGLDGSTYSIYRVFLPFDTTSIPDGSTIQKVWLRFTSYGPVLTPTAHVVASQQAAGNALATSDYHHIGSTSYGSVDLGTAATYYIKLSDTFITNSIIDDDGYTKIALIGAPDYSGTAPTEDAYTYIYSNHASSTDGQKPQLIVEYSANISVTGNNATETDRAWGVPPYAVGNVATESDWANGSLVRGNCAEEDDNANQGSASLFVNLIASGTFDGKTLGCTPYGSVFLQVSGTGCVGKGTSDITVQRSANGSSWTTVTTTITKTEPSTDEFLIHDRRPQYSAPVIAYGETAYYRVSVSGVYSPTVFLVPEIDRNAITETRLALEWTEYQQHGVISGSRPYGQGYQLLSLSYRYFLDPTETNLNAVIAVYNALLTTLADGYWHDANQIYREISLRMAEYIYISSKLVRNHDEDVANDLLTLSTFVVTKVISLPLKTITTRGWSENQNLWNDATEYQVGDRVRSTTWTENTANYPNNNGTGAQFRCTTAGTSGSTEPSWNYTGGSTTNDGTVVWKCITTTQSISPHVWDLDETESAAITFLDPNQLMGEACTIILHTTDSNSSLYQNSAAEALAEAHMAFAYTGLGKDGDLVYSEPDIYLAGYGAFDAGYARFTLTALAMLVYRVGAGVYPEMDAMLVEMVSYFSNNCNTEPYPYNQDFYNWIPEIDLQWQHLAFELLDETDPLGELGWSSAILIAESGHYGAYQPDGIQSTDSYIYDDPTEEYFWLALSADAIKEAMLTDIQRVGNNALESDESAHGDAKWSYNGSLSVESDITNSGATLRTQGISSESNSEISFSIARMYYKTIAAISTISIEAFSKTKAFLRSIAVTVTGIISKFEYPWSSGTKHYYPDIFVESTVTPSLSKRVGLVWSVIESTVTATVTPLKATLVSFAADATVTALAIVVGVGKRITYTTSSVASIVKTVNKNIMLVVSTVTATVRKMKPVSIVVNSSVLASVYRTSGVMVYRITIAVDTVVGSFIDAVGSIVSRWNRKDKTGDTWNKKTEVSDTWTIEDETTDTWYRR